MDIKLNAQESIRIFTHDYNGISNFVDVTSLNDQSGLRVTNHSLVHQYIEIRRKSTQIAIFLFPRKSFKKYANLGWWSDAEVVYSINEVEFKTLFP